MATLGIGADPCDGAGRRVTVGRCPASGFQVAAEVLDVSAAGCRVSGYRAGGARPRTGARPAHTPRGPGPCSHLGTRLAAAFRPRGHRCSGRGGSRRGLWWSRSSGTPRSGCDRKARPARLQRRLHRLGRTPKVIAPGHREGPAWSGHVNARIAESASTSRAPVGARLRTDQPVLYEPARSSPCWGSADVTHRTPRRRRCAWSPHVGVGRDLRVLQGGKRV